MSLLYKAYIICTLIFSNYFLIIGKEQPICATGFQLTFDEIKNDYICYQLKGPETFKDKFVDCDHNFYNSELHFRLDVPKLMSVTFWTEYTSSYLGGPFINFAHVEGIGSILYNVSNISVLDDNKEFCVVVSHTGVFTAVECNEMHFRYCFVKPCIKYDIFEECKEFQLHKNLNIPKESCLIVISNSGAPWMDAKMLCVEKGGALISKAWLYGNTLSINSSLYPLGMIWDQDDNLIRYESDGSKVEIINTNLQLDYNDEESIILAATNNSWRLVNNFRDVVCENAIRSRFLSLNVSISPKKQMILIFNDTVDMQDIISFTDSFSYRPSTTTFNTITDDFIILSAELDGYYWCRHVDPETLRVALSTKILFIKERKGDSIMQGCVKYSCEGDFNEGAEWKPMLIKNCSRSFSPVEIVSSDKIPKPSYIKYDIHARNNITSKGELKVMNNILQEYRTDEKINEINTEMQMITEIEIVSTLSTPLVTDSVTPSVQTPVRTVTETKMVTDISTSLLTTEITDKFLTSLKTTDNSTIIETILGEFRESEIISETTTNEVISHTASNTSTTEFMRSPLTTETTTTQFSKLPISTEIYTEFLTLKPATEKITITFPIITETAVSTTESITTETNTEFTKTADFLTLSTTADNTTSGYTTTLITVDMTMTEIITLLVTTELAASEFTTLLTTTEITTKYMTDTKETEFPSSLVTTEITMNEFSTIPIVTNTTSTEFTTPQASTVTKFLNSEITIEATGFITTLTTTVLSVTNFTISLTTTIMPPDEQINQAIDDIYQLINNETASILIDDISDALDQVINIYQQPLIAEHGFNMRRACVYWHFLEDGSGFWSEEGCALIKSDSPEIHDTCQCNHLTHFAEVLITISTNELINQVIANIYALIENDTPILIDDVTVIFDQINNILDLDQNIEFPGELLNLLDKLGSRIDLDGSGTATVVRENIALLIADATLDNPVRGLILAANTDAFAEDSFNFLTDDVDVSQLNSNINEMVVLLPESVIIGSHRLSFVVFGNARMFSYNRELHSVNSRVLSIKVGNDFSFEDGEVINIHLQPLRAEHDFNIRRACVYWHFLEDESGFWSEEGCTLITSDSPEILDTCQCTHLTHFAEVLITVSPDELIEQVISDIHHLFENETTPILINDINDVFDQINNILNLEEKFEIPGELLNLLDELGSRVDLDGSGTESVVRENIALLIADATPDNPVRGVNLIADTDAFGEDSFIFVTGDVDESQLNSSVSEMVVLLPVSVTEDLHRLTFVIFRNARIFNYNTDLYSINSRVVSINVGNDTQFEDGEVINIHMQPLRAEHDFNIRRACVYWHFLEDESGFWSEEGCTLITSDSPEILDTCQCTHLTHFAEVLITVSPDELIDQVIGDIHHLFENETTPILINDINDVFDQINNILSLEETFEIPGELLNLLDELGSRIDLDGSGTASVVRGNIALLIADATPDNPVRGVILIADTDAFGEDSFDFVTDDVDESHFNTSASEVVALLPVSVTQDLHRLSFVMFRNARMFSYNRDVYSINSRVVSVNVGNDTQFEDGEVVYIHQRPLITEYPFNIRRACVYWHFFEDGSGFWSEEGCTLIMSDNPDILDTCQCGHLAHLAEVLIEISPGELIGQVIGDINILLENETTPVLIDDINNIFNQINNILGLDQNFEFPGELLNLLDDLGSKIDLDGSSTASVVRENIALLIADVTPDNPVRGVNLIADTDAFEENSFNFVNDDIDVSQLTTTNVSEVVALLPVSVTQDLHRLSFVMFRNARMFSYNREVYSINSRVVSINVGNDTQFEDGEVINIHLQPLTAEHAFNMRRACVYWHFLEDGSGFWSEEGCTLTKSESPEILDTCQCNHLTHFAEILITISPDDLIEEVIDDIHLLFENTTAPIVIDDITDVFDQINNIIGLEENFGFPGELLNLLDELGSSIDLDGIGTASAVRENIALLIVDATPDNRVRGVSLVANTDAFVEDSFYFVTDDVDESLFNTNVSEVVVFLPVSATRDFNRLSVVAFRNARMFSYNHELFRVNSRIFSVKVGNDTQFEDDEVINIHLQPLTTEYAFNMRRACVYWHFLEDGSGFWSEEGCTLIISDNPEILDTCQCNHLTHFAEVLITISPDELIDQVIDDIYQLLENETATILIDHISEAFDQINNILSLEQVFVFPEELFNLIDQLVSRIDLEGSNTSLTVRDNIALLIADATPDNLVHGVAVASNDIFGEDSFSFITDDVDPSLLFVNVSEVVVSLPISVTQDSRRISFVVFRDARMFSHNREIYNVNSRVISVNMGIDSQLELGEVVNIHLKPLITDHGSRMRRACVYWQFLEDGSGFWSEDGCTLIMADSSEILDTCQCTQLKHIADVLIRISPEELIRELLRDLRDLLDNQDNVTADNIDFVIEQMDILLSLHEEIVFPGELFYLLHELAPRINLSDMLSAKTVRDNVAFLIFDQQMAVNGITVARGDDGPFTDTLFDHISGEIDSSTVHVNVSRAAMALPNLVPTFNQISFMVFRDPIVFHEAFRDGLDSYIINSPVINVNVKEVDSEMENFSINIINIYLRPVEEPSSNMRRVCVYWNFIQDGSGHWVEEGCTLIISGNPELLDYCECELIFTYYAEALIFESVEETDLPDEIETTPTTTSEYTTTPTTTEITTSEYITTPTITETTTIVYTTIPTTTEITTTEYTTTPTTVETTITEITTTPTTAEITTTEYTTTPTTTEITTTEYTTTPTSTEITTTEYTTTPTTTEITTTEYITTPTATETTTEYTTTPTTTEITTTEYTTTPTTTDITTTEYTTTPTTTEITTTEYTTTPTTTEITTTEYTTTPTTTEITTTEYTTTPTTTEITTTEYTTTSTTTEITTTEYTTTPTTTEITTTEYTTTPTTTEHTTIATTTEITTELTTTTTTTTDFLTTPTTTETITEFTTLTTSGIIFPTIPPSEQIEQALDDLEDLLNQTDPITVDDITSVFDQVNDILNFEEEDAEVPGTLLQMLDDLSTRIDLNGSSTGTAVRENIALLMADVTTENPIRGIALSSRDSDAFSEDSFNFLTDDDSTLLDMNVSEAVVSLPQSVTRDSRRISFVVFRDSRAFTYDNQLYSINSRVLSINVEDYTHFEENEVVKIHLRPMITEFNRDQRRVCAYWSFLDDGTGYWSQKGCTLIPSSDSSTLDTCQCDHLTHFAEVLIRRPLFSQFNEDVLEVLSIIGCVLSILGLIAIALTATLFRSWRINFRNQIWLQLCVALFVMSLCFLIIVFSKYEANSVSCMLIGIGLHYSLLASFCWMLVIAIQSYKDLVLVFACEIPRKRLITSGFSWGVPAVIVSILLVADPESYSGHFEEMNPSSNFCYPTGTSMWLTVYMPISLMLFTNWAIFILIVQKIGFSPRSPRSHKSEDIKNKEALICIRISIVLAFLFGLPWVFGLFAYNIVAAYFFTCTVTTQGFVLFVLIVCGNTKTRNLWIVKLKLGKNKLFTVTSSYA